MIDRATTSFVDKLRLRCLAPACLPTLPGATHGEAVGFASDISGSMDIMMGMISRFAAAWHAIRRYTAARLAMCAQDLVCGVVFDLSAHIVCELVPIAEAESRLLRPMERLEPGGGTDIAAGIRAAQSMLGCAPRGMVRRMIVLSDGQDGGHPYRLAEACKASGIIIDTIGVAHHPLEVDEACLKRIASTIDGVVRYRFISDAEQLAQHFEAIARGLRRL